MCDVIEYSVALADRQQLHSSSQNKRLPFNKLCLVLAISAVTTAGELVMAQMTHSITLLVLVHQNIYNCITLAVACATAKLSKDESLKNTFGWHRMEVVGSISSLIFLFSLCFATFIEALQTLAHTDHLDAMHHPEYILLLLAAHVAVWLFIFTMTGGYTHLQNTAVRTGHKKRVFPIREDNKRQNQGQNLTRFIAEAKLKEVLRDLSGVGFVLVTCCLVKYSVLRAEYTAYIDPSFSIVYILSLIWSSVSLVKDSCLILLQTIPGDVEVTLLQRVLLAKFPEILGIHEMHVWTYTPNNHIITAHIKYNSVTAYKQIHRDVDMFFIEHGFREVTLQPEFLRDDLRTQEEIDHCSLACQGEFCEEKRCCPSSKTEQLVEE